MLNLIINGTNLYGILSSILYINILKVINSINKYFIKTIIIIIQKFYIYKIVDDIITLTCKESLNDLYIRSTEGIIAE